MNKIPKRWLKNTSWTAGFMVLLIILLIVFQYIEVIEFVNQGRQTIWGIILFILAWPVMTSLVVVTFEQASGMSAFLMALVLGVGFFINVLYFITIGSLVHWILPMNPYSKK